MTEEIRAAALKQIDEKRPQWARHPDSTTGLTVSAVLNGEDELDEVDAVLSDAALESDPAEWLDGPEAVGSPLLDGALDAVDVTEAIDYAAPLEDFTNVEDVLEGTRVQVSGSEAISGIFSELSIRVDAQDPHSTATVGEEEHEIIVFEGKHWGSRRLDDCDDLYFSDHSHDSGFGGGVWLCAE